MGRMQREDDGDIPGRSEVSALGTEIPDAFGGNATLSNQDEGDMIGNSYEGTPCLYSPLGQNDGYTQGVYRRGGF